MYIYIIIIYYSYNFHYYWLKCTMCNCTLSNNKPHAALRIKTDVNKYAPPRCGSKKFGSVWWWWAYIMSLVDLTYAYKPYTCTTHSRMFDTQPASHVHLLTHTTHRDRDTCTFYACTVDHTLMNSPKVSILSDWSWVRFLYRSTITSLPPKRDLERVNNMTLYIEL